MAKVWKCPCRHVAGVGGQYKMYNSLIFINFISRSKKVKLTSKSCIKDLFTVTIATKAKCRHLKKLTCQETLRQVFSRDTVSHYGVFDPALWTVAPLISLVQLPPPPIPCVIILKHMPQNPFTGKIFWMTTFCIAFYESYLSTGWCHDVFSVRVRTADLRKK